MHINCDYIFNLNYSFPKNLLYLDDNFYNLFTVECMKNNSLGGCCLFTSNNFKLINGFPIEDNYNDSKLMDFFIKNNYSLIQQISCDKILKKK